jgi:hypothetical protein
VPSRIHCPQCNTVFAYSPALLGKTVRCKQCQHAFAVVVPPAADATPATSVAPRQQPLIPPPLPPRAKTLEPARTSRRDELVDDERPRARRWPVEAPERTSGAGALIGLIAVFVVGFLILAVGIGYLLWPSSPATQATVQGPAPASNPMAPIDPPRGLDEIMKNRPAPPDRPGVPAFPNFPDAPPGFAVRPGQPAMPPLLAPKFAAIIPLPIIPTPLTKDSEERVLAGPVESVIVAGGGRLLLLHMPRERKIAVFDVTTGQRVKYVPAEDDRALIAGGMNVFVVYLPGKNLLERYNCATLEREGEVKSPFPAEVLALAMGNASNGPLVAALGGARKATLGGATFGYFDPSTGKEVGYEKAGEENPFGLGTHNPATTGIRVSADGNVVAGYGGPVAQVDVLDGGRITRHRKLSTLDRFSVSADGRILFAHGQRFTHDLNPVGDKAPGMRDSVWFIPAVQGDFFISLRAIDDRRGPFGNKKATADVYLGAEGKALWNIGELSSFEVPAGFEGRERSFDQNLLLVPEAKLLVVVPTMTRDRLLLYRADLDAALDKADLDYFRITSRPPTLAVKGETYRYTVVAKSKKAGVKVVLDSGPKGMTVTPAGLVSWDVPKNFAESEAGVILKATDGGGKEVFQSFRLSVKSRAEVHAGTNVDESKRK